MAFILLCWKKLQRLEALLGSKCARACLIVMLTLGCLTFTSAAGAETTIELRTLKIERQEPALYLTAEWQFELPDTLADALLKGITLYFVTEVELTQERWYFYNQRVASAQRHVRLQYQPLTRRWRVNTSPQPFNAGGLGMSLGQSYDSQEEAMGVVRRIVQWRIADATDFKPDAKQFLTINFKLDLSQLPRPLQIGAASQNDWNIAFSKTTRLELAP